MSYLHEQVLEQVYIYGYERPDDAWILSSFDTWHPNPFYSGPAVPHPEDYPYDEDDLPVAPAPVVEDEDDDDLPF